jgi:hypothetical protein
MRAISTQKYWACADVKIATKRHRILLNFECSVLRLTRPTFYHCYVSPPRYFINWQSSESQQSLLGIPTPTPSHLRANEVTSSRGSSSPSYVPRPQRYISEQLWLNTRGLHSAIKPELAFGRAAVRYSGPRSARLKSSHRSDRPRLDTYLNGTRAILRRRLLFSSPRLGMENA